MSQINRACPVCGDTAARELLQKGELRLVRCPQCSMVYANPVPAEFASGEYYNREVTAYYVSPAKLQSDYAPVRFERELRIFRRHCRGGAVLDVGCSSGAFLWQLNQRFPGAYEILGTDASGPALDYAESKGVPILRGDFLREEFAGKSFAAVTFWAVLEHVNDPGAFVRKAESLLKPGGFCFILVPNMRSLAARLLASRYRYIYPQHLNYFTKETLLTLVGRRFSAVEFRTTHFNPVVIWQDWRGGGREVPDTERGALLQRTTAYKQSPWLKPLKILYRLTEQGLGMLGLADNLVLVLKKNGP